MFGDMAEIILQSQRVMPEATLASGFEFEYPDLQGALLEIL
jgi:NAD dependent epimerase/dehydratase family enzyme